MRIGGKSGYVLAGICLVGVFLLALSAHGDVSARTEYLLKNRAQMLARELVERIGPDDVAAITSAADETSESCLRVMDQLERIKNRHPDYIRGLSIYRMLPGQRAVHVVSPFFVKDTSGDIRAPLFRIAKSLPPPGTPLKGNDENNGAFDLVDYLVMARDEMEPLATDMTRNGREYEMYVFMPIEKDERAVAILALKVNPGIASGRFLGAGAMIVALAGLAAFFAILWAVKNARVAALAAENREFRSREASYEELASTDPLTGIGNRRQLLKTLDRAIAGQEQAGAAPFCVALFNIDHFKPVNDRLGSSTGDNVLATLAGLMKRHKRERDLVCRFASDEFALFMPETELDEARRLIHEYHRKIDSRLAVEAGIAAAFPKLGTTVGIIQYDPKLKHTDKFIHRLSQALQMSKNTSRGRTQIFRKSDLTDRI